MSHGRMHDKPRASPANREDQVMADLDAALPCDEPLTLAQRRRVREAIRAAAAQPGERERAARWLYRYYHTARRMDAPEREPGPVFYADADELLAALRAAALPGQEKAE